MRGQDEREWFIEAGEEMAKRELHELCVKELSGQPSEVDNDQLRAIIKAAPLTTMQKVAKELSVDHSIIIQHLKQIGKVKKQNVLSTSQNQTCTEKWPWSLFVGQLLV